MESKERERRTAPIKNVAEKCHGQNVTIKMSRIKMSFNNNIAGQKCRAQNVVRTFSIIVLASICELLVDVSFEILS